MHVGLVREVHQVVDHQAVVALDAVQATAIGPVGAFGPCKVVQLEASASLASARPDPDEAEAL